MTEYRDYIFDIETYPNIFTLCLADTVERRRWVFEISTRKDERDLMLTKLRELKKNGGRMVGFNNINFDYPVLHYFLRNQQCSVKDIYDKAMEIIEKQSFDENFRFGIPKKEWLLPQMDLLKIHHFDNKAKMTSLKMLEFNMRSDDIQDLPFPVGQTLSSDQMDTLIRYNKHDVYQTFLFYEQSLPAIEFRAKLSEEYNRDFTNHNDTKIGKDYFVQQIEREEKGSCYRYDHESRSWKVNQTKRKNIDLGEVILPYVKFKRPEFNALKDWFSKQVIEETKGVFTDIYEYDLGDELPKYCELKTKRSKKLDEKPSEETVAEWQADWPKCWLEERELKSGKTSYYRAWNVCETLNVVVDGITFYCGVGGIHAARNNSVFKTEGNVVVKSVDVASFYPNLAIQNRLYPEHLGEVFCSVYQDVYNLRKTYPKGTPENAVMKLALNGTYGASNDKFSPFYDPKFTMSITINGQLSLLMLAEMLMEVPTVQIIMANTDGLEYVVEREYEQQSDDICKQWEELTKLELEGEIYNKLFIRDCNNYLGVFDNGKIKRKGAYEYDGLGWHQNQSSLIVPMCAEKVLLEDVDPYLFMQNHSDIYDFCLRTKVPRSMRLVSIDSLDLLKDGNEEEFEQQAQPEQNITRFVATKEGRYLVKIMPPLPGKDKERKTGVCVGQTVTVCNKMKDFKGEPDCSYYLAEVKKLTEMFEKDLTNDSD